MTGTGTEATSGSLPPLPLAVAGALRRRATYVGAARELTSLLRCAARYPGGLVGQPPPRATTPQQPVILIHGFGHNRSGWWVMRQHLAQAGFEVVDTFNYLPQLHDIPASARLLAARVEQIRSRTGARRVHLVGHSLGGILARWYVQELDGAASVDTVVTLGTPHEGTVTAYLAPGRTLAQLRPRSWVLRRLQASARPSSVRWVAFYSNVDELVSPSRSAMIRHPALGAVNILAKDHGHVSLLLSPRVARAVVNQLEAAEGRNGLTPLTGLVAPAAPAGGEVSEAGAWPVAVAAAP